MTDKELIQLYKMCSERETCEGCPERSDFDPCPIDRYCDLDDLIPRLEALLAENQEMNIQIQKEICKRVEVEAENERLSGELRATERAAELLNHANAILKEQNEHLREVTKMVPKWVSVSERLPETIPCSAGTEYSEAVILLTSGRKVLTAIYDGYGFIADAAFWDAIDDDITHWAPIPMPLPELPSTEGVE